MKAQKLEPKECHLSISSPKSSGPIVEGYAPVDHENMWQKFKAGDEAAFEMIYKNYAEDLFRYGMKIAPNRSLVQEAIQTLFIQLWSSRENLSAVKSIKSYLFASLRRIVLRRVIKDRKRNADHINVEKLAIDIPSAEHLLLEKQRFDQDRKILKKALEKLNGKQREILHLKFYTQLSYEEIMDVMSLNRKSAYNLLARSLKKLRDLMMTSRFLTVLFGLCSLSF